jgi:hypothetical protein
VIAAVARHEVGLHTRSARHPTGPEYVQRRTWEEGLAESLRHERDGVAIIEAVFGQPASALSTHYGYATPHAHRSAALLGLPYIYAYPAAPPLYSVSWYAGALGFPWSSPTHDPGTPFRAYFEGFDGCYPHDTAFHQVLARLDDQIETCLAEGQPFLTLLLYHPQRLRLAEFIDRFWSPNGVNLPPEQWGRYGHPARYTPAQVATALANFRRLARRIREDSRLRPLTVAEAVRRYGYQPAQMTRDELHAAAQAIVAADEVLLHPRFSPAEILLGLAEATVAFDEAGPLPERVARREVLGPVRNSIYYPEALGYSRQMLVRRARELLAHVDRDGHLPAHLGEDGERVGPNHLYRALAELFLAVAAGSPPEDVRLRPMPRAPALGQAIGQRFFSAVELGLIDPDLDGDTLYRHGKLQTWTLKPALPTP